MKKMKVVILVGLLYLSGLVLVNENFFKVASANDIQIEEQYLYNITVNLSKFIFDPETIHFGMQKGRAYGTPGERKAAEYLKGKMENLSLYDPTENPYKPYREAIQESQNTKLEILDRELKINGTENITDFFITPFWNNSFYESVPILKWFKNEYNKSRLTHAFNYTDLKVYCEPHPTWWYTILDNLTIIDLMLNNESITNLSTFFNFILPFFEKEYGFKFSEINETNAASEIPWYNDIYEPLCSSPYVFINKTNAFNPDRTLPLWKNLTKPWSKFLSILGQAKLILQKWFWSHFNCKGKILYDFNNNTYDMYHANLQPLPTIQINNTIGIPIYENPSNYTISYKIKQNWNDSIVSYNVIGQINGTDPNKTVILCSFYDCWWNQGTSDSATGVGIVLALAKYMKELEAINISPKYNVKIILFGGEEYGFRGAYSYEKKHYNENIVALIDINQIGYNQTDPRQTLNIITNRLYLKYFNEEVGGRTDYGERTDDTIDFETWCHVRGGPSNDAPFAENRSGIKKWPPFCRTMCFIKGYGWNKNWRWKLHHRDGENHTQGDTMNYYDENDVSLTTEMVWNVTKSFAYDPNVWFNGNPTFNKSDTNNDGYYDTLNVSYTIDTSWPSEHTSVRLVLYPRFQWKHPGFPIFYRLREEKEYVINPDGISDYINITLPDNYPKGEYRAELYLCNSTGDAILDTVHLIGVKTFIDGWELINRMKDVWIDFLNELLPLKEGIYKLLGIDVVDWIKRLPDLRDKRVRDILIDIIGFYVYRNDSYCYSGFYMHPPNRPPNPPDEPIDLGKWLGVNWSKTKTTDPDPGDRIRFQWNWNGINGTWSIWPYAQNKYQFKPHLWLTPGEKTIKVRAKNPWNPNVFSNWSNITNVNINSGGYFDIVTSQTNQDNNINPNVRNSFDPTLVVVDENVLFQGYSMGYQETPDYDYNFSGLSNNAVQSIQKNFSLVGSNYVNFTTNYSGTTSYYNITINVVNISACFNCTPLATHPNQTILFNDTTISNHNLTNWTWNFGDGNISYDQNTSHNYSQTGAYNISLTVNDNNNEEHSFWQIMHVETNPPETITVSHYPVPGILGNNITIYADFYDNNESGVSNASVNISYPDGTTNNFTMYTNENSSFDYEYLFNDTMLVGWYYYTVWVTDLANNTNSSSGYGFQIAPAFGNSIPGNMSKNINDNISGSNFTILVNGTAESITALIQSNLSTAPKTKCMIYRVNDSELIGVTEEKILNTGDEADWVIYNFTDPKPDLTTNTPYILACWSDDTCNLSYLNVSDISSGRYKNKVYGTPDPNIEWDNSESRLYSIYCTYSTTPEILSVTASPNILGYGYSTTIAVEVEHYYTLVENITVNITRPDNNSGNYSMTLIDDTFQYSFGDTWSLGQYNYSIWLVDKLGTDCSSDDHGFNVSVNATISICTVNDSYSSNETVNLTDPPPKSPIIGYKLLDDGEVLHIWNKFDSYYFDTDNGIQLTNHYNKYWSHNVLMLGYYNNDQWNLIYGSDNLSGFNQNITSDNETYVNATLWKDLTYQGYDFRLAIRYYLGVDDNELTVIPYIKNLDDENIPYTLGFAWEINDIQVDMTYSGDYIEINGTSYDLDETLDLTFTNMTIPVYCWDNSTNETYVCDYTAIPYFYIREDMSESTGESLYLRWNENLDYRIQVKSKDGEYNAPVTLGIKIGTLNIGQEKQTSIYWHDAAEITYYFDAYDAGETWASNPGNMIDGSTSNYASTTISNDIELCDNNTCNGSYLGIISKAEIRAYGYWSGDIRDIILRPVFKDGDGDNHYFTPPRDNGGWSPWYDITSDNNAPESWQWSDVKNLDCDVESTGMLGTVYCSKVELRVTYTPNNYPMPSNSYPANGSIGISIQPVLNITVTDTDGDNMNITWLSNSSGSWQVFGVNNSVSNGTYHQSMSNASVNGQWWYWKLNVTDGTNYTVSDIFSFYTGNESKVVNLGSTHFKGYLLMQVQYYNTSNSTWVVVDDTVDETSPRIFKWASPGGTPGQHIFALDTVFNGLVNTGNLSGYGNGTYRVYVCVRDPYGNLLNAGGGIFGSGANYLEDSYEFTITFD